MPQRTDRPKAFTLMEMILVVVIISLMAAIVVPQFLRRGEQAKVAAARTQIQQFDTALEGFASDVGRLPETQEGLEALIRPPAGLNETERARWRRQLKHVTEIPTDPWGNPYVYRRLGNHPEGVEYELFSPGPDGQVGTEDDIGHVYRTP